jgi:DHA2 family multidrug resistance protein
MNGSVTTVSVVEYGLRRTLIVAGVMLAALLQTLDSTITNVALPAIQGNTGASSDEATWVINGYTIAVVIVIPIIPWLQSRLGRKRYFIISVAGFTAMSFLCGVSSSIDELVLFRIAQGIFGAGLLATGQTILRDTFPESQIGLSQAIFALGAVGGPALGPPIGGWLVDNLTWNYCFLINIVPGIVSALILASLLRDPAAPHRAPFDAVGLCLLVAGVGALQYVLSEGERYDWFNDPNILACAAVAVGGIGALVIWELRFAKNPVVDIAIFADRSLAAGVGLALILGAALLGTQYILPQYVQNSLGFTATLSGLLVLVKALPIALATLVIAPLVTRVDARYFIAVGFAFTAISCFWQGAVTTPDAGFGIFVGSLVLGGAAVAFLYVPLSVAVLGAVPRERGGSASAWINVAVQLGGSISIALLSTLVDRRVAFHQSVLAGDLNIGAAHLPAIPAADAIASIAGLVSSQSAVMAYADTSFAVALFAAIAIPLVFIMRKPRTDVEIEFGG